MTLEERRQIERDKYRTHAYPVPHYRMSPARMDQACSDVESVDYRTSYLDVSTGRGEMLEFAKETGFSRIQGTEVVHDLLNDGVVFANAWELPFRSGEFDLLTMYDVIEHILPEDEIITLAELGRVVAKDIFLTANNKTSNSLGVELHVNRKPYEVWNESIRDVYHGCDVVWISKGLSQVSETWHIRIE